MSTGDGHVNIMNSFHMDGEFQSSVTYVCRWVLLCKAHIDWLVLERRNSSALAMELRLSCTNPSILFSLQLVPFGAWILHDMFTENIHHMWLLDMGGISQCPLQSQLNAAGTFIHNQMPYQTSCHNILLGSVHLKWINIGNWQIESSEHYILYHSLGSLGQRMLFK